jgi:hypothetical protein
MSAKTIRKLQLEIDKFLESIDKVLDLFLTSLSIKYSYSLIGSRSFGQLTAEAQQCSKAAAEGKT